MMNKFESLNEKVGWIISNAQIVHNAQYDCLLAILATGEITADQFDTQKAIINERLRSVTETANLFTT